MRRWVLAGLAAVLAGMLSGCGFVGPPLPPALDIPTRIEDLRAIEYGPDVLVQFTLPDTTTDNLPLTAPRSVDLYIGPAPTPFNADVWAAGAQHFLIPATGPGPLHREVPAQPWIGQQVTIAVRATGRTGRASDWSNLVILDVNPPLARPASVTPANVQRGVSLTWTGDAPRYRILRAAGEETAAMPIAESSSTQYVDESTSYGTRYTYVVVAINGDMQQSHPSEAAVITPTDVFAPAVPAGLGAVPGTQSIELAWARNTESDFAGYNIFRAVDGGPFVMLPIQLDAPAYSDTDVASGRRYSYAIVSVDTSGNVSDRSPAIEAAIP